MRLIRNVKGVSKTILILLLLVAFSVGALLSFVWSLGYYGPWEHRLPSKSNITVENVKFDVNDATYFNATVLNPSYSLSSVQITQFLISTVSGTLVGSDSANPSLPYDLSPGSSQTFKVDLNWGDYTGQVVNVIVFVADGSGATYQTQAAAFGNLAIINVGFYADLTVEKFNVTVGSSQSVAPVDITSIKLNGSEVTSTPSLPYKLNPDASAVFELNYSWNHAQGKIVKIEVNTAQGYIISTTEIVPSIKLAITNLTFNTTDTSHFNAMIKNDVTSADVVDLTQVTVNISGQSVTVAQVSPALPQRLLVGQEIILTFSWNWSSYQGQSIPVTVTVQTKQGFVASGETTIP